MYCNSYAGEQKKLFENRIFVRIPGHFQLKIFVRIPGHFQLKIFVRIPGHFQLKIFVRKPNCSNSETFVNRGSTVHCFGNYLPKYDRTSGLKRLILTLL